MYHVSAQGVDERMINVHYYYYYYYYYYYWYYYCCCCYYYYYYYYNFQHCRGTRPAAERVYLYSSVDETLEVHDETDEVRGQGQNQREQHSTRQSHRRARNLSATISPASSQLTADHTGSG